MGHRFHFFRAGGVDQVSLRDGADLLALDELDQKLWVALAMPSSGIDVDAETLKLLDHDSDGRIRAQDVLAAVAWAKDTFKQPGDLLKSSDSVELSSIADAKVVAAAKRVLADLGKKNATSISVDDTVAIHKAFAETVLNGDGIVIPTSTDKPALRKVIEDAIAAVGSVKDRSGNPGIDKALAETFFAEVDARAVWLAKGQDKTLAVLDGKTEAAVAATNAVKAKIEDYFTRCRVAAFDERGAVALAGQEPELVALSGRALRADDEQLAKLPLAKIDSKVRLSLGRAINPAWIDRIEAFVANAIEPIVGERSELTPADLTTICDRLAPYQAWLDGKPTTKVDNLDVAWLEALAGPDLRKQLAELLAADEALAADYAEISSITRAVRMQRDFGRILRNFVNFSDFYARKDGVFQSGTLYLDARALHLCIPVLDAAKHGAMAGASDACILYCQISRNGQTKQIAVALTNGDADNVFVGRNGVFYDREGRDWDATITAVISNPISVRAAFWSPYKLLVKKIEEGVQKRARAAEERSHAKVSVAGTDIAHADERALAAVATPPPPPPPAAAPEKKFDLGTIAAIGVAIGGIGTLFGALFATLFGLGFWLPVGLFALIMMISGPSMLLAWLKLRRRNLGPILDANGWAINSRARINVAFGAAMTELPKLPRGAKRSLDDPYADKRTPWKRYAFAVVFLGLFGGWYLGRFDDYLPNKATSIAVLGENAPKYKSRAQLETAPANAAAAKP